MPYKKLCRSIRPKYHFFNFPTESFLMASLSSNLTMLIISLYINLMHAFENNPSAGCCLLFSSSSVSKLYFSRIARSYLKAGSSWLSGEEMRYSN